MVRALAIALAIATASLGLARGTWAVGGSDSSCYALMAQSFANGVLQPTSRLASDAPWAGAPQTLAPGGFIPSPVRDDAASPVCAPGFALVLAAFYAIGGTDAIFLVSPLAGALLVYLTFVFGRRLAGDAVGLAAAVLTAAMPALLFQLVQPMNDVVVAALWLTVATLMTVTPHRFAIIGALTGAALLIRPNLAPAVIVMAAWCLTSGWRPFVRFSAAAAPFGVALLWLNAALYGHPFASGYGSTIDLFSLAHVGANVQNYGRAIIQTQLGFPLAGFAALVFAPPDRRRPVVTATLIAVSIAVVYLVYRPLPEWWYLRFLLPASIVLTVLGLAAIAWASGRKWPAIPVALLLVVYAANSTAMRDALDLWRLERRFRTAAAVAAERLPATAVFLTVWESGSVRYHAAREAVLWDSLPPGSLDSAVQWLAQNGHEPYIMIEDWEEPLFRARFSSHSLLGALDWPPRFDIERRVKIYRPADREPFFHGENIPTDFVWPNRR